MQEKDFIVKVRRLPGYEPAIAIRFEMNEGFGEMLVGSNRKASPSTAGEVPETHGTDIRAGRFVHVLASGRRRQSYALSRLDDERLQQLPDTEWTELTPVTEFGIRYLDLPELGPVHSVAAVQISSEPTPTRASASASVRPAAVSPAPRSASNVSNPRASVMARAASVTPSARSPSATPNPRVGTQSPSLRTHTSGQPGTSRAGQRGALPHAGRTVTPETSRRVASPRPVPVRTLDPLGEAQPPVSMEATLGHAAVAGLPVQEAKQRLLAEMNKVAELMQAISDLEARLSQSRERERDLLDVLSKWQSRG